MLLVLCTVHMHIITLLVPTTCINMLDVGPIFVLLQCFEMTHGVISHIVRVRREEFVYQQLVYVLVKTAPR